MSGFVEGIDRSQSTLFPAMLDDYVAEDNLVRAVDAFVEGLDLGKLGFGRVAPLEKGRPSYHPATLLKIYIYGYLNRVPSSRRLERECQRNIELVWLTGQLAPDFKTIADFRNGLEIRRQLSVRKTSSIFLFYAWRPRRNPIEIAINVYLEQRCRMIFGTPFFQRRNPTKALPRSRPSSVNRTNQIVLGHVVIDQGGKGVLCSWVTPSTKPDIRRSRPPIQFKKNGKHPCDFSHSLRPHS